MRARSKRTQPLFLHNLDGVRSGANSGSACAVLPPVQFASSAVETWARIPEKPTRSALAFADNSEERRKGSFT